MNFLADESVDRPVVERLRQEGHPVLYIAELGPGMPDDAVLNLANQEAALLLTADKDFGEMVFRQRLHMHGVVLIRLAGLTPVRKAEIVALAVREHLEELPRSFAVIMPGIFRVRRVNE
jgi:predicted nuclease of predicted toxin-antitoxin system